MENSLASLTAEIVQFRDERDWAQFHTPKNLAAALSIEAGELQETMLWKSDVEVADLLASPRSKTVQHEVADILIYALLICHSMAMDPAFVIREKLELNREKYPADKARGRSDKYTNL